MPIIDPDEYPSRYTRHITVKGEVLNPAGQLIAMVYAVWAASFGFDASGVEELPRTEDNHKTNRERCNRMVEEILRLVDLYGILRRPSWDGVRALLLLLPLTVGKCRVK